ncbi:ATP-grasp domain-containing protein [Kitasatospora sp. NPDC056446]|uniref:ATP-grasp domain-containing protein n=1 Tax=Kitasatospora sp. NPDC056446 TaxID=3345819 RepID=UPI0036A2B4F9
MTPTGTTAAGAGEGRRIVVTGVGANPGFDLARSLQHLGHHVIATDAQPLAPGLLLPDVTARVTPRADDPRYGAALLRLCRDTDADALIVGIEPDLPPVLRARRTLAAAGVRVWLPTAEAVHSCLDKADFHRVLAEHGVPTPRSWLPDQLDQVPKGTELVVKPRGGHGAQHVHFPATVEQARVLCELVPDPFVQERIHGEEFTADCLVDRAGRASMVLRRRSLVKAGLAAVAVTFHDERVAEQVRRTLAAVGAAGLSCVQGFITDHGPRAVVITEVNVRVAGGFALAEAAGADLIAEAVNGLFGQAVDHGRLAYRDDVFLTKYTETLTVGDVSTLRALQEQQ